MTSTACCTTSATGPDRGQLVLPQSRIRPEARRDRRAQAERGLVPCYANSVLFQERALAAVPEWTPATIMQRRTDLLTWARQRWHVDEVAVAEGVATEDEEIDEVETVDSSAG